MKAIIYPVLFVLLILPFTGCQSTEARYRGKAMEPQYVIPIPGTVINEQWETTDLTISYGYSESNLNFKIDGKINLAGQYSEIYHYLDFLDVYLLFLDSDLTVITAEKLSDSFSASPKDTIPFNGSFRIPENAVTFSFAYHGTVREMDRRNGNVTTLWLVPK